MDGGRTTKKPRMSDSGALEVGEILSSVMSHLGPGDLFTCFLISRSWRVTAMWRGHWLRHFTQIPKDKRVHTASHELLDDLKAKLKFIGNFNDYWTKIRTWKRYRVLYSEYVFPGKRVIFKTQTGVVMTFPCFRNTPKFLYTMIQLIAMKVCAKNEFSGFEVKRKHINFSLHEPGKDVEPWRIITPKNLDYLTLSHFRDVESLEGDLFMAFFDSLSGACVSVL